MVWLLEVDSESALVVGLQDGGDDASGRPHTVHLLFARVEQPVSTSSIRKVIKSKSWRAALVDAGADHAAVLQSWPITKRVVGLVKLVDQPSAYTHRELSSIKGSKVPHLSRLSVVVGLLAGLGAGYGAGWLHAGLASTTPAPQGDCQVFVEKVCRGREQTLDMSHQMTLKWVRCATDPLLHETARPAPRSIEQAIEQVTTCLHQIPRDAKPIH